MAGEWKGTTNGETPGHVSIRVTAGGSAVMETEFPGTEHEMVSMYYLDGDELVRKHHCSMGNQPEMALDVDRSTQETLAFAFVGGTNFDPALDSHVHDGEISIRSADKVELSWSVYDHGEKVGANEFHLERQ